MTKRPPHIPSEGSKSYKLLALLLRGVTVDVQVAYLELNLPAVQARVAELRRVGWPVRSVTLPHPQLKGEKVVGYSLDTHFRAWMTENPSKHPGEYPHQDGRGKFAGLQARDFKAGVVPGKGKPAILSKGDE